MNKKWIVTLEEIPDSEDVILPIPDELMAQLDWQENDELKLDLHDDYVIINNLSLEKRKDS